GAGDGPGGEHRDRVDPVGPAQAVGPAPGPADQRRAGRVAVAPNRGASWVPPIDQTRTPLPLPQINKMCRPPSPQGGGQRQKTARLWSLTSPWRGEVAAVGST